MTVALALGLRQGEALGLKWDAVDVEGRTLNVRVALQRVGGEWKLAEPKSLRSCRAIALPEVVLAAFKSHRVQQLKDRLAAGQRWQDLGFVFTSSVGTPLEPSNVTKKFRKLLVSAKMPLILFHDLRHTAATFLLAQGVDARTIIDAGAFPDQPHAEYLLPRPAIPPARSRSKDGWDTGPVIVKLSARVGVRKGVRATAAAPDSQEMERFVSKKW